MFKRLFLCLFAVLFLTENYATAFVENHQVEFKVNTAERGAAIVNVADNINVWSSQMWCNL